jgi:hypothetical protein
VCLADKPSPSTDKPLLRSTVLKRRAPAGLSTFFAEPASKVEGNLLSRHSFNEHRAHLRGWRETIMRSTRTRVLLSGAAVLAIGVCAELGFSFDQGDTLNGPVDASVSRGLRWLVSTQGKDGGWGQDGGETSDL